MEKMKFYTEEEITDKHIGKKGTLARDKFEGDLQSFLIGEAIRKARQSKNLTQEELGNLIGKLSQLFLHRLTVKQQRKPCQKFLRQWE